MRTFLIMGLLLGLAACSAEPDADRFQGFVAGRQLHLAPRDNGTITAVAVAEGDRVAAGDLLFTVDADRARATLVAAQSARAAAAARLADLERGGRPPEIRAAEENLKEARAALTLAEQNFTRSQALVARGNIAPARLDQDRAALNSARARVTAAEQQLALVRLPARADVIAEAGHMLAREEAAVARARADLEDRSVFAPVAGRVETLYRRPGEAAGPAQPVLALLPPDLTRIRFFVPEPALPRVRHGGEVALSCDNCPSGLQGRIVFIADQAEFTPPVIFTERERAKLVYLVDVRPDQPQRFLDGQPVMVTLP